jgi:diguanylate cyclase (GGDEF)-like protein
MSLIRQVWLLLLFTLAAVFVAAVGVSLHSARQYLDTQLTVKNNDAAQALALTLSQQRGDPTAMELVLSGQFDTGTYQRIELISGQNKALVSRQMPARAGQAPAWFISLVGIQPTLGVAQVSNGWKQIGRVEVLSQVDYAHDELWHSTWVTVGLLALVAGVVGRLALLGVRRIREPLDAVVSQAAALTERQFITIAEPSTPELGNVARAMNACVLRLNAMFNEQASQVEHMRRLANCDPLTGVYNRSHFMSRLKVGLGSEDGQSAGVLMLVRLTNLQALNHEIGHAQTDKLLQDVAAAMSESAGRLGSQDVGRLNGTDFALILPLADSLREPAVDVAARLRNLLKGHVAFSSAVVGAVRWFHGESISSLLASADQALARAEARGPFAVELDMAESTGVVLGEDAWRLGIESALAHQRLRLVSFPVLDVNGDLVHQECPLRLRLEEDGPWLPAALWLPMARRTHLTGRIDLAAVKLALREVAADGVLRSVNLSPGSLQDRSFVPGLCAALEGNPAAAGLWLEVAEAGAMRQLPLLRELVAQVHVYGAKVGLEHAGESLSEAGALLEAGLDFVKLDASFTEGLAEDAARAQHVTSSIRMLHGIGLLVYAEGVGSAADWAALRQCGVDGVTGPAVSPSPSA